jgi:hypothetical protein
VQIRIPQAVEWMTPLHARVEIFGIRAHQLGNLIASTHFGKKVEKLDLHFVRRKKLSDET